MTDVSYNRSIPQDWPELQAFAANAIPSLEAGEHFGSPGLWDLANSVTSMDRFQLRSNYFYAMGIGVCELAKELRHPEIVEKAIQGGVNSFMGVEEGTRVNDSGMLGAGFLDLIDRAGSRIAPETKLALEFLSADATRRAIIRTQYYAGAPLDLSAIRQSQTVHSPMIKQAVSAYLGPPAEGHHVKQMKIATTAATGILIRHLLYARTGKDFVFHAPDEASIDWLEHESVARFVQRATALRIADFRNDPSALFEIDDEVVRFVDPGSHAGDKMPESDYFGEASSSDICPAANINGLVPMVWSMSVEIVRRAAQIHRDRQE